jgi:hypothetical protein
MERAILLQVDQTAAKHSRFLEFERHPTELANFIIKKKVTLRDFHSSLVNDHPFQNAVVEPIVAVRHVSSTHGKPTPFMCG